MVGYKYSPEHTCSCWGGGWRFELVFQDKEWTERLAKRGLARTLASPHTDAKDGSCGCDPKGPAGIAAHVLPRAGAAEAAAEGPARRRMHAGGGGGPGAEAARRQGRVVPT